MRKIISILRWIAVMLISLLGFVTAPIIFPIAYLLRNVKLFRNHLLWYYYDDEDTIFGTEWFRKSKGLKDKGFKTAYLWSAIRNPAWNLQASLQPEQSTIWVYSSKGMLNKYGKIQKVTEMAVLKYVNIDGIYSDNKGEFLSLQHSILGSMFLWYEVSRKLYWRYSYAKNVYKDYWVEIQLGTNDRRYTWRLKIKKTKIFE